MSKPKGTRKRREQTADPAADVGDVIGAADAPAGEATAVTEPKPFLPAPVAEAFQAAAGPAPVSLELDGGLEIKDVEAVHRRLTAALNGASALTVDIGRVAPVDTAGVQMLLALRRSADLQRLPLTFTGESAALIQALGVLGLEGTLTMAAAGE